jgi:basic membrane protein A
VSRKPCWPPAPGDFDPSPFIGTLENEAWRWLRSTTSSRRVSPDLQAELDTIQAGIIDGSIPVESYLAG